MSTLKSSLSRKTGFAWVSFGVGLLATVFVSLHVKQGIEHDAATEFAFACDQATLKIQDRLDAYALILRGGAALFAASIAVDRKDWLAYVETLRVRESVPGVQGIGFAQVIPADRLATHIARIRSEGFPEYTVRPPGERAIYTSVVYIKPFRDSSLQDFGFDMFSEPVRRAAMEQARDTGEAALSGKVELVQDTCAEVQAGALMYVSVYRNGMPLDTVGQRRAALIGWVYSPYHMADLIDGIILDLESHEGKPVDLHLYDGIQATPASLLFECKAPGTPIMHTLIYQQRTIDFNGHQWLLEFDQTGKSSGISYAPAWAVLASGLVLNALLFGLMFSVINTRANAVSIAAGLTEEIRHREELIKESEAYKVAILNSVPAEIAVVDRDGVIRAVNEPWRHFALENGIKPGKPAPHTGIGTNYLAACQIGSGFTSDVDGSNAGEGIQAVLDGRLPSFKLEYPCHSPTQQHWSTMTVTPLGRDTSAGVVVTHTDITQRKLLEDEREDALRLLKKITNRVPGVVYQFRLGPDGSACLPFASEALREIYRVSPEDVREDVSKFFACHHPDDNEAIFASIQKSAQDLTPWGHEYRVKFDDGTVRWMSGNALPEREADGSVLWHGFITDITERKQAEEKLHLAASVFTHAREGIMITATDGTIIDVNDAFSDITGYDRNEAQGCNPHFLSSGRQEKEFYAAMWRDLLEQGRWCGEIWNRRKNGEMYAVMQTVSAVRDAMGNTRHYVALFSDITSFKENERQLKHIAHFDALTGLPNRMLLVDRLHQGMAQALRREQLLAVAFLDLDGFKVINDNHGHEAGDRLLIATASRMRKALREVDTLARLGGDEFVAVLLDLADVAASVPMLTRLLAAAAQPVQVGDIVLQVSASLGVTFYPQAEDIDADQLMRQADQAMYQAKLTGKNRYHFFDAEQDRSIRSHHENLERIRRALAGREFVLHYQPKVNMRTGAVIGAEALIRWQHPERGLLPPAEFLPVVENHPLAVGLGEWVIDNALAQMERWQSAGLDIPVSVNVGNRQLQQADFVERLRTLLAAHPGVRPGGLVLEVLETSALEDLAHVSHVINACREIGVMFALDDFGTGYSSLTHLKCLPVIQIKIDQSFVSSMLDSPDDLAILEGVLGLAAAFHHQVVAEGVETVEHGEMLLQFDCELAQGYGIARPMPAHEMSGWSTAWRTDPSWGDLPAVSRDDLPLLFASADHRSWVAAIEAFLKGEREVPPPMDCHQSRFGVWLDDKGLIRFGTQPAFESIAPLHRQVHVLGAELLELQARGRNPEALARLGELHGLRDALLKQLKILLQERRL